MAPSTSTTVIHEGKVADVAFNSVMPPLYPSSTFAFDSLGVNRGFDYTRSGNPTRQALERCIAALEGGAGAVCTGTGMAAVAAVLHLLRAGDHVIAGHDIYGGTYRLMSDIFARLGVEFSFVPMDDPGNVGSALRPSTRLIWIETPSNPLLKLADIAAISALGREREALTVVDNTFLTPVFQRPLALGASLVVHSTTKYINGHSDVVGGAVVSADGALAERVQFVANACGLTESPWDAWLVLRGLRTLPQRMAAHERGATALAQYLVQRPEVRAVHYPGLHSHPQRDLAQRQMTGAGGVVTFELNAGQPELDRFFGPLRLFALAESLGGVESLIEAPWFMSHQSMPEGARVHAGIKPGMVRVSVGLEAPEDLIADLEAGFEALRVKQRAGG